MTECQIGIDPCIRETQQWAVSFFEKRRTVYTRYGWLMTPRPNLATFYFAVVQLRRIRDRTRLRPKWLSLVDNRFGARL